MANSKITQRQFWALLDKGEVTDSYCVHMRECKTHELIVTLREHGRILGGYSTKLVDTEEVRSYFVGTIPWALKLMDKIGADEERDRLRPMCRICGEKRIEEPYDHCGSDGCIPF